MLCYLVLREVTELQLLYYWPAVREYFKRNEDNRLLLAGCKIEEDTGLLSAVRKKGILGYSIGRLCNTSLLLMGGGGGTEVLH